MVKNNPGEPYSRISSEEAFEMQQSGNSTVVDVRNQDEYEAGHVKGAIWIPVDEIVQRFNELPEDGHRIEHRDGTIGVYVKDPFGNYIEYIWYSQDQSETFLK